MYSHGNKNGTIEDFRAEVYIPFRKSIKPIVSAMVNEFNRSKSTFELKNAAMARSGSIDRARVKRYLIDDDIFQRKVVMPEGKNYSFHFLIDWSASMRNLVENVAGQAIIMSLFCRAVEIDFDVTSFTSGTAGGRSYYDEVDPNMPFSDQMSVDTSEASMISWFNSNQSKADFESCALMFFFVAHLNAKKVGLKDPEDHKTFGKYGMGGTPLNASLVLMREHMAQYKQKHNIEVQNLVVLSDGCSQDVRAMYSGERDQYLRSHGLTGVSQNSVTDSRTNKVITTKMKKDEIEPSGQYVQTRLMLETISGVNKFCYYLTPGTRYSYNRGKDTQIGLASLIKKNINDKIRAWSDDADYTKMTDQLKQSWKKNRKGFASMTNQLGYDKFYLFPVGNEAADAGQGLDGDIDTSKKNVAKELAKLVNTSADAGKNNRAICTEFVRDFTSMCFS